MAYRPLTDRQRLGGQSNEWDYRTTYGVPDREGENTPGASVGAKRAVPSFQDLLARVPVQSRFVVANPGNAQKRGLKDINEIQAAMAKGVESNYARQGRMANKAENRELQRGILGDQVVAAGTYANTPEFLAGFETEAGLREGGSKRGIEAGNYGRLAALQRMLRQPVAPPTMAG